MASRPRKTHHPNSALNRDAPLMAPSVTNINPPLRYPSAAGRGWGLVACGVSLALLGGGGVVVHSQPRQGVGVTAASPPSQTRMALRLCGGFLLLLWLGGGGRWLRGSGRLVELVDAGVGIVYPDVGAVDAGIGLPYRSQDQDSRFLVATIDFGT